MDKIVVRGELINDFVCDTCEQLQQATIELSPPTTEEISKLKEGDEVLVKHKVVRHNFNALLTKTNYSSMGIERVDIIAILPQPQQEFCKCSNPQEDFSNGVHPNHCKFCHLPIQPHQELSDPIMEQSDANLLPTEQKEIEELKTTYALSNCIDQLRFDLSQIRDKLNEVIRNLNRKPSQN